MLNPEKIEEMYKEFMNHITDSSHDGIVPIDLKFLHQSGLLQTLQKDTSESDDLTQYFNVIESMEKVTLFNDQFIVWIIPKMQQDQPLTYVMIALNHPEKANLEVVFITQGVYNTPRHVLQVLQHFLVDMLETEETLISIKKNQ